MNWKWVPQECPNVRGNPSESHPGYDRQMEQKIDICLQSKLLQGPSGALLSDLVAVILFNWDCSIKQYLVHET